jgi:hypothetical protein
LPKRHYGTHCFQDEASAFAFAFRRNAIMHCKGVQKKGERNIGTSFMMYQQEDLFYEYRRKDIGSQLQ